jgi:hypothetical protein
MKTFILSCESFDTRASLEDRLKWVKAGRVLLVMPVKQPPTLARQDLIRLRRRASGLQAQLGLVSTDAVLQAAARSAGMAVFSSREEARQEPWPVEEPLRLARHRSDLAALRHQSKQMEPVSLPAWLRWVVFGLAIMALLALAAVFVPGAKVELNLPREDQSADLAVTASVDQRMPDLIAGIPLHEISLEVSATIEQKTTGTISVGDAPARGLVLVTNLTDQPLTIPSGSVVRSVEPAVRFSIDRNGSLLAGPGTSISLPVTEMDGAGALGNLPAGAIVAMDPPLGYSVAVRNPEAITGGSEKQAPALSQQDLINGHAAVEKALLQAFMLAVREELPESAILVEESITITSASDDTALPPYDRPVSSFPLSRSAEVTGYYYLATDLEAWAALALDASLPAGRVSLSGRPFVAMTASQALSETQVQVSLIATRQVIPTFDPRMIAIHLRGMQKREAMTWLQDSLAPGSRPVITLSPGWWFRLPILPERIQIDG